MATTAVFREAVQTAQIVAAQDIPHIDVALIRKYLVDLEKLGLV